MTSTVVPHEGTWIEIRTVRYQRIQRSVVPHEGTWIEIEASVQIPLYGYVVPHEGTWIEITEHSVSPFRKQPSFPTRERGLK